MKGAFKMENTEELSIDQLSIKLTKDLKKAAQFLTAGQVRYMVDLYYQLQEYRKASANQVRSAEREPNALLEWFQNHFKHLEGAIKSSMDIYSDTVPAGRWAKSIYGIGPVISAGLLAHIDIEKAKYAGQIWAFAGIEKGALEKEWKKGQKRPWNAKLRTLCWKIGDSFKKFHNKDECFYGKIYEQKKAIEIERNEAGLFRDQAEKKLERFKIGKTTDAYSWYSIGKLPPAHLDQRAMRYATKMFLSHWHWVAYETKYMQRPPAPYIIQHGGHEDLIMPPNYPDGI